MGLDGGLKVSRAEFEEWNARPTSTWLRGGIDLLGCEALSSYAAAMSLTMIYCPVDLRRRDLSVLIGFYRDCEQFMNDKLDLGARKRSNHQNLACCSVAMSYLKWLSFVRCAYRKLGDSKQTQDLQSCQTLVTLSSAQLFTSMNITLHFTALFNRPMQRTKIGRRQATRACTSYG